MSSPTSFFLYKEDCLYLGPLAAFVAPGLGRLAFLTCTFAFMRVVSSTLYSTERSGYITGNVFLRGGLAATSLVCSSPLL